MFKRQTLVRCTLATALLSSWVLVQPAQAGGLLGGAGGSLGGNVGGSVSPRQLDIGGNAAGQASRDPMALPRGDKAKQLVSDTQAKVGGVREKADDKANEKAAEARDTARGVHQHADQSAPKVQASGQASVSR